MEILSNNNDDDVENPCDISIVKIKPECREKYGGHEHVAAQLKRHNTTSPTVNLH